MYYSSVSSKWYWGNTAQTNRNTMSRLYKQYWLPALRVELLEALITWTSRNLSSDYLYSNTELLHNSTLTSAMSRCELCVAVFHGCEGQVRRLLESGVDVDSRDDRSARHRWWWLHLTSTLGLVHVCFATGQMPMPKMIGVTLELLDVLESQAELSSLHSKNNYYKVKNLKSRETNLRNTITKFNNISKPYCAALKLK